MHVLFLQLAGCHTRILELEELLASTGGQLQQSEHHIQQLAAEQDAVKRNLLTAEAELHDVGEYSTKMFRQVRHCKQGDCSCVQPTKRIAALHVVLKQQHQAVSSVESVVVAQLGGWCAANQLF